jgi:two-component system response regulator EvgA
MNVAIVEDHLLLRDFVRKVCLGEPGMKIVAEAATGLEAVENITHVRPDLVVLDIELPDFDGIEALTRIRKNGLRPRIIILSGHINPFWVSRIEHASVQGVVDKQTQTAAILRHAIRAVRLDQTYYSATYLEIKKIERRDPHAFEKLLSSQQILVLSMVADLFSDHAIGERLKISERTVETHRTTMMRKFGVHSRVELIQKARSLGFTFGLPADCGGKMHESRPAIPPN